MLVDALGKLIAIQDAPIGACIALSLGEGLKLGFIVALDDEKKYILDMDAANSNGVIRPAVYRIDSNFSDEGCILYETARIRPDFSLAHLGAGYYGQGGVSKVLFISGDALIVQAVHQRTNYMFFDLITGMYCKNSVSSWFHTNKWAVDLPGDGGNYDKLVEYNA